MRVFVTGGTGAIGQPAVRSLVAAGHEVVGTARSEGSAATLREFGAEPVSASIFDVDALTSAMRGCDAVVNLATKLPSTATFVFQRAWEQNHRIRTEGAAAVATAAAAVGAGVLVQESVSLFYRDGGSSWLDEDAPVDHFPAARGNHAAEATATAFTGPGRRGVVLRFGWFYGPGAAHAEEFVAFARRGIAVQIGPADAYTSSIHVDDGGAAVVAALDAPAGTWNVVEDEPVPMGEYADALMAAVERKPWLRTPGRLAGVLGHRVTSLTRSTRVSNRRFRRATGWAPAHPSVREGWPATVAALRRA